MAVHAIIPFLVVGMLVTGSANTILTKFQDRQCVRNCDGSHGKPQMFEQPIIQTQVLTQDHIGYELTGSSVQMFIGESGCWLVVFGFHLFKRLQLRSKDTPLLYQPVNTEDDDDLIRTSSQDAAGPALKPLVSNADDRTPLAGRKIILLALPACCDITGTTLLNVGLLFVAPSIYQMTRAALILFVGLFSVMFLKRKLFLYHWLSMVLVVLGVALVGLAGVIWPDEQKTITNPDEKLQDLKTVIYMVRDVVSQASDPIVVRFLVGIFLIAGAQIFTATQFCLEEWILENYALEPVKVVAWEGLFGFTVTVLGQILLHYTVGVSKKGKYGYFDAEEGYRQMFSDPIIGWTSLAIMVSIGGFNFFGLSVTRSISATSRSIIDTCRTLFIWIVSLGLGWERFKWLQVAGFGLLVYGTFIFNDLVQPPIRALIPSRKEVEERGELLPEEPIEHM